MLKKRIKEGTLAETIAIRMPKDINAEEKQSYTNNLLVVEIFNTAFFKARLY